MSLNLGPTPPRSPEKGYATTGSNRNSGSDSDGFAVDLARKGRRTDTEAANTIYRNIFGDVDRDTPTPPPAVDRG